MQLNTIVRVCVCVHPWTKGFFQPIHLPLVSLAGALSTPWQTQCNEAMPWSGKHGLITRVYLRETFLQAVTLLLHFLFHGSCMLPPLNRFSRRCAAAFTFATLSCSCAAPTDRFCRLTNNLLKHLQVFRTLHHAVLSPSFPAWELS